MAAGRGKSTWTRRATASRAAPADRVTSIRLGRLHVAGSVICKCSLILEALSLGEVRCHSEKKHPCEQLWPQQEAGDKPTPAGQPLPGEAGDEHPGRLKTPEIPHLPVLAGVPETAGEKAMSEPVRQAAAEGRGE